MSIDRIINHINIEQIIENKEVYAKLYSEGNNDLSKLLMGLWNLSVEVYMCHPGHELGNAANIILYLPETKKELIYNLVESVYNLEGMMIRLGKEHNKKGILIDIRSYYTDTFFKVLTESLNKDADIYDYDDNIMNGLNILSNFDYQNCDLYYEISNINNVKSAEFYVNYNVNDKTGKKKYFYIVNKEIDFNEVSKEKDVFMDESLEHKIKERTGFQKTR